MESNWRDLLVLLRGGKKSVKLISELITDLLIVDDLPDILHEVVFGYISSDDAITRGNAAILLESVCENFHVVLAPLLIESYSDGELISLDEFEISSIFRNVSDSSSLYGGHSVLANDTNRAHGRDLFSESTASGVYDRKWLKQQQKFLRKLLRLETHTSDTTMAFTVLANNGMFTETVESNPISSSVAQLGQQKRKLQSVSHGYRPIENDQPRPVRSSHEAREERSEDQFEEQRTRETWFARLVRYMVIGLLHERWERRHGNAFGLTAIINGLNRSVPSERRKPCGEYRHHKLPRFICDDILCCGLTALALERYFDFGVEALPSASTSLTGLSIDSLCSSPFPVKEAAAALIASVLSQYTVGSTPITASLFPHETVDQGNGRREYRAHAMPREQSALLRLLKEMVSAPPEAWNLKHGALLALQYCIPALFDSISSISKRKLPTLVTGLKTWKRASPGEQTKVLTILLLRVVPMLSLRGQIILTSCSVTSSSYATQSIESLPFGGALDEEMNALAGAIASLSETLSQHLLAIHQQDRSKADSFTLQNLRQYPSEAVMMHQKSKNTLAHARSQNISAVPSRAAVSLHTELFGMLKAWGCILESNLYAVECIRVEFGAGLSSSSAAPFPAVTSFTPSCNQKGREGKKHDDNISEYENQSYDKQEDALREEGFDSLHVSSANTVWKLSIATKGCVKMLLELVAVLNSSISQPFNEQNELHPLPNDQQGVQGGVVIDDLLEGEGNSDGEEGDRVLHAQLAGFFDLVMSSMSRAIRSCALLISKISHYPSARSKCFKTVTQSVRLLALSVEHLVELQNRCICAVPFLDSKGCERHDDINLPSGILQLAQQQTSQHKYFAPQCRVKVEAEPEWDHLMTTGTMCGRCRAVAAALRALREDCAALCGALLRSTAQASEETDSGEMCLMTKSESIRAVKVEKIAAAAEAGCRGGSNTVFSELHEGSMRANSHSSASSSLLKQCRQFESATKAEASMQAMGAAVFRLTSAVSVLSASIVARSGCLTESMSPEIPLFSSLHYHPCNSRLRSTPVSFPFPSSLSEVARNPAIVFRSETTSSLDEQTTSAFENFGASQGHLRALLFDQLFHTAAVPASDSESRVNIAVLLSFLLVREASQSTTKCFLSEWTLRDGCCTVSGVGKLKVQSVGSKYKGKVENGEGREIACSSNINCCSEKTQSFDVLRFCASIASTLKMVATEMERISTEALLSGVAGKICPVDRGSRKASKSALNDNNNNNNIHHDNKEEWRAPVERKAKRKFKFVFVKENSKVSETTSIGTEGAVVGAALFGKKPSGNIPKKGSKASTPASGVTTKATKAMVTEALKMTDNTYTSNGIEIDKGNPDPRLIQLVAARQATIVVPLLKTVQSLMMLATKLASTALLHIFPALRLVETTRTEEEEIGAAAESESTELAPAEAAAVGLPATEAAIGILSATGSRILSMCENPRCNRGSKIGASGDTGTRFGGEWVSQTTEGLREALKTQLLFLEQLGSIYTSVSKYRLISAPCSSSTSTIPISPALRRTQYHNEITQLTIALLQTPLPTGSEAEGFHNVAHLLSSVTLDVIRAQSSVYIEEIRAAGAGERAVYDLLGNSMVPSDLVSSVMHTTSSSRGRSSSNISSETTIGAQEKRKQLCAHSQACRVAQIGVYVKILLEKLASRNPAPFVVASARMLLAGVCEIIGGEALLSLPAVQDIFSCTATERGSIPSEQYNATSKHRVRGVHKNMDISVETQSRQYAMLQFVDCLAGKLDACALMRLLSDCRLVSVLVGSSIVAAPTGCPSITDAFNDRRIVSNEMIEEMIQSNEIGRFELSVQVLSALVTRFHTARASVLLRQVVVDDPQPLPGLRWESAAVVVLQQTICHVRAAMGFFDFPEPPPSVPPAPVPTAAASSLPAKTAPSTLSANSSFFSIVTKYIAPSRHVIEVAPLGIGAESVRGDVFDERSPNEGIYGEELANEGDEDEDSFLFSYPVIALQSSDSAIPSEGEPLTSAACAELLLVEASSSVAAKACAVRYLRLVIARLLEQSEQLVALASAGPAAGLGHEDGNRSGGGIQDDDESVDNIDLTHEGSGLVGRIDAVDETGAADRAGAADGGHINEGWVMKECKMDKNNEMENRCEQENLSEESELETAARSQSPRKRCFAVSEQEYAMTESMPLLPIPAKNGDSSNKIPSIGTNNCERRRFAAATEPGERPQDSARKSSSSRDAEDNNSMDVINVVYAVFLPLLETALNGLGHEEQEVRRECTQLLRLLLPLAPVVKARRDLRQKRSKQRKQSCGDVAHVRPAKREARPLDKPESSDLPRAESDTSPDHPDADAKVAPPQNKEMVESFSMAIKHSPNNHFRSTKDVENISQMNAWKDTHDGQPRTLVGENVRIRGQRNLHAQRPSTILLRQLFGYDTCGEKKSGSGGNAQIDPRLLARLAAWSRLSFPPELCKESGTSITCSGATHATHPSAYWPSSPLTSPSTAAKLLNAPTATRLPPPPLPPPAPHYQVRGYQVEGVAWWLLLVRCGLRGGVLADEMGLGKSLQALMALGLLCLQSEKKRGTSGDMDGFNSLFRARSASFPRPEPLHSNQPSVRARPLTPPVVVPQSSAEPLLFLVVCPASLVLHWEMEVNKFFPLSPLFSPEKSDGDAKSGVFLASNDRGEYGGSNSSRRKFGRYRKRDERRGSVSRLLFPIRYQRTHGVSSVVSSLSPFQTHLDTPKGQQQHVCGLIYIVSYDILRLDMASSAGQNHEKPRLSVGKSTGKFTGKGPSTAGAASRERRLGEVVWDAVVLDEAHMIKNHETATAKACFALKAKNRLALTGTPVQNQVDELWSIMNFVIPGYLGEFSSFSKTFVKPIAKSFAEQKSLKRRERALFGPKFGSIQKQSSTIPTSPLPAQFTSLAEETSDAPSSAVPPNTHEDAEPSTLRNHPISDSIKPIDGSGDKLASSCFLSAATVHTDHTLQGAQDASALLHTDTASAFTGTDDMADIGSDQNGNMEGKGSTMQWKSLSASKVALSTANKLTKAPMEKIEQNKASFTARFNQAIDVSAEGLHLLRKLHKQVLPFILRRLKSEVARELPSKTIVDVSAPLSALQRKMYIAFLKGRKLHDSDLAADYADQIGVKSKALDSPSSLAQERNELSGYGPAGDSDPAQKPSPMHSFQAITYLKLLSVHPALVISPKEHSHYRSRLLYGDLPANLSVSQRRKHNKAKIQKKQLRTTRRIDSRATLRSHQENCFTFEDPNEQMLQQGSRRKKKGEGSSRICDSVTNRTMEQPVTSENCSGKMLRLTVLLVEAGVCKAEELRGMSCKTNLDLSDVSTYAVASGSGGGGSDGCAGDGVFLSGNNPEWDRLTDLLNTMETKDRDLDAQCGVVGAEHADSGLTVGDDADGEMQEASVGRSVSLTESTDENVEVSSSTSSSSSSDSSGSDQSDDGSDIDGRDENANESESVKSSSSIRLDHDDVVAKRCNSEEEDSSHRSDEEMDVSEEEPSDGEKSQDDFPKDKERDTAAGEIISLQIAEQGFEVCISDCETEDSGGRESFAEIATAQNDIENVSDNETRQEFKAAPNYITALSQRTRKVPDAEAASIEYSNSLTIGALSSDVTEMRKHSDPRQGLSRQLLPSHIASDEPTNSHSSVTMSHCVSQLGKIPQPQSRKVVTAGAENVDPSGYKQTVPFMAETEKTSKGQSSTQSFPQSSPIPQRRCLIFAQHRATLDVIEDCVLKRYFPTVPYARIDGTTPPMRRAAIAQLFNHCVAVPRGFSDASDETKIVEGGKIDVIPESSGSANPDAGLRLENEKGTESEREKSSFGVFSAQHREGIALRTGFGQGESLDDIAIREAVNLLKSRLPGSALSANVSIDDSVYISSASFGDGKSVEISGSGFSAAKHEEGRLLRQVEDVRGGIGCGSDTVIPPHRPLPLASALAPIPFSTFSCDARHDCVDERILSRAQQDTHISGHIQQGPKKEKNHQKQALNCEPSEIPRILLCTARSCGLGLNLTAADTAIFVEHDWNPFVDLQAMDRVHRIGQLNPVTIYRLLANSTIEARIVALQDAKKHVANEVINDQNGRTVQRNDGSIGIREGFGATLWNSLSLSLLPNRDTAKAHAPFPLLSSSSKSPSQQQNWSKEDRQPKKGMFTETSDGAISPLKRQRVTDAGEPEPEAAVGRSNKANVGKTRIQDLHWDERKGIGETAHHKNKINITPLKDICASPIEYMETAHSIPPQIAANPSLTVHGAPACTRSVKHDDSQDDVDVDLLLESVGAKY